MQTFHLPVHLSACYSQVPMPGARNSIWILYMGGRSPGTRATICYPPRCASAGNWLGSRQTRTQVLCALIWDTSYGCLHFCVKYPPGSMLLIGKLGFRSFQCHNIVACCPFVSFSCKALIRLQRNRGMWVSVFADKCSCMLLMLCGIIWW